MPDRVTYSKDAIGRARAGALHWLKSSGHGYPRSHAQEAANALRRGYDLYDDFEAPPIFGYEALEREGLAIRHDTVIKSEQERIHFEFLGRQNA